MRYGLRCSFASVIRRIRGGQTASSCSHRRRIVWLYDEVRTVNGAPPTAVHMDTLSRLMVRAYCENNRKTSPEDLEQLKADLRYVGELNPEQSRDFLKLADSNHVVVRALTILQ